MAQYNLVGYFRGETEDGCTQFSIRFIPTFGDHLPWREVELVGETPVIVQYTSNSNPFIPIMESRCSITAVANEYFMDLYGPDIQHCQVVLRNEDTQEFEWVGYLTNNLMNAPMDGCMEPFTFEAIDCLSTLEYFDYAPLSGKKQIVTFQDILADMASNCMLIQKLVVDSSMKNENGQVIHMDELQISEQNFFSSDTDEPWNKKEVLEEICRFCGYTAFQWKDTIYLYDKQAHTGYEWNIPTDSNLYFSAQISSGDFHTYVNSGDYIRCCNVTEDNIAGTGADISLQTIYNKVTVKDSFYEIEDFVPDIYDDELLSNKLGEEWRSFKIHKVTPEQPRYVNKRDNQKTDASEAGMDFYQRPFYHKWYETKYWDPVNMTERIAPVIQWYNLSYVKYNGTLPIGFHQDLNIWNRGDIEQIVTVDWKAGETAYTNTQTETIQPKEYATFTWDFNVPPNALPTPYFRINSGEWQLWNKQLITGYTRGYVGGTVVDLGVSTHADSAQYNYEVESDISFDRYLMICQHDNPDDYHANPRYSGFTASDLNSNFKPVFSLTSGWTKPIIIDDNCYLIINASALFERYTNRDYINSDWTGDSTGISGDYNIVSWGIFTGDRLVQTCPPAMVFKLGIGNYWWNGSGWTTTETPFYVNMHTPVDDDGYIDFSKMWNTSLDIINNMSWTEYTGAKGYKIPLKGVDFDFNSDIVFDVCLPSKIQVYQGNTQHDGMNSYCWVKDLKVDFAVKGQENYDLTDVVYENVIDEFSVNTLDDVTLKLTTYPNEGKHSYSNVGYNGDLIDLVKKDGLDNEANKMEENIIKTYVNQWNTNTIEETLVLDRTATPLSRIKDTNNGKFFHVCGLEIDYARARQRVNLIESKKWNQVEE